MSDLKFLEIIEIIDKNKQNMPEQDYVKCCNLLKDLYDSYDTYLDHKRIYDVRQLLFVIAFLIVMPYASVWLMNPSSSCFSS